MDLATATPVEIDTVLAEIYTRYYAATRAANLQWRRVEDYAKAVERREAGDVRYGSYYTREALAEHEEAARAFSDAAREILRETAPFNTEFHARGGWTRFYLVDNAGGHVHSSMQCSTCFPTTEFIWLPERSGSTEEETVALAGSQACTVCFPSAPVDVLRRKGTFEAPAKRKSREEREAKKAATLAKKQAKALFPEDVDKYFKTSDRFGDRISTLAAAKKFLTDGADWNWDHPMYLPADRDAVAALLAARLGTTAEEEIAAAHKRAQKRR